MKAIIGTMIVLATVTSSPAQQPEAAKHRLITPFDYRGVTINDGPLLRQMLEVRNDYLRVPNDDYLKGFRQRAGRPAPGNDLGGWYTPGIFHVFGQVLSGLARMYAATGDEACRDKLNALIHEWAVCIEPDGYFYPTKPPCPPHYIYEKMNGGLLDAHLYAGNTEALELLSKITDWAEKNLDHTNPYDYETMAGFTEWYTLSENLYRTFLVTGQARYRDYAKTWEYSRYWNLYADGKDIFSTSRGYHAYSHVNTLNGAAAAYAATGETRYLDIIRNAYDYLQANQVFATGGYGPVERMVPEAELIGFLDTMDNHFETQCGSWAAFKLCKYLMSFTGDARYGDWIERLMINGIGASIPTTSTGEVMYFSRHNLSGACKIHTMPPWACCAGTRIQAVADYDDLIFFKDADCLYVNMFTPATVKWVHGKTKVTLRQEPRFPESDRITLRLALSDKDTFAVRIRRPAWLAGDAEISVNDQRVSAAADEKHWFTIQRTWADGDCVKVRLPMRFNAERFPKASARAFPAAITYGPVVMTCRSPEGNPVTKIDFAKLAENFVAAEGEPLTYHLRSNPGVLVRPFYALKQGEWYFLYFDPAHPWTRIPPNQLIFTGNWGFSPNGDMRTTNAVGASVECTFESDAVRWVGRKSDDGGRCMVQIDGKIVRTTDQYDEKKNIAFQQEFRDLGPGKHVIRLTLLEDKTPASKDRILCITGFDIIRTPASQPTTQPAK